MEKRTDLRPPWDDETRLLQLVHEAGWIQEPIVDRGIAQRFLAMGLTGEWRLPGDQSLDPVAEALAGQLLLGRVAQITQGAECDVADPDAIPDFLHHLGTFTGPDLVEVDLDGALGQGAVDGGGLVDAV